MANPRIDLLVLDVDGVLTDGGLLFDDEGRCQRRFHIQDGLGVKLWQSTGRRAAILTSKRSGSIESRARMMGVDMLEQGQDDKLPGFMRILDRAKTTADRAAFVGDDLLDLVVMRRVGYPIAVANAVREVRQIARYVTVREGGHGAVREAVEHLLESQEDWDDAIAAIGADR